MRNLFYRYIAQTSSDPIGLKIDKADGVFLFSGNDRYLDLVSGVSVSNVGHCNKEIVDAVKDQVDNYFHLMVYGEIIQAPQVLHAQLLCSLLPESLQSVYYLNSGSEANEAALKLAKRLTGRRAMIGCINAYHGSTHGALSMMGNDFFKDAFSPLLPDVSFIRFNSLEDLSKITEDVACVIMEPVQGEGGVILPKDGYLQAVREKCDKTGTILIFDEVQTGFGRTGKMFAFQKFGVVPDIITFAKALGGGMPLGAMLTSQERMSAWQSNPPLGHITTFGGHPVCCAAALASLKLLLKEDWIARVEEKSLKFERALVNHPAIKEIRRAGLLIAVDLGSEEKSSKILNYLLEEKLLSDYFLFNPTSFRIAPPLCINDDEIDIAIDSIIRALDKLID